MYKYRVACRLRVCRSQHWSWQLSRQRQRGRRTPHPRRGPGCSHWTFRPSSLSSLTARTGSCTTVLLLLCQRLNSQHERACMTNFLILAIAHSKSLWLCNSFIGVSRVINYYKEMCSNAEQCRRSLGLHAFALLSGYNNNQQQYLT